MPDLLQQLRTALADRFRVDREIGRGATSTVYLAEDLKHHRPVAIKVLSPELTTLLGADRFLREIEVAAKLTHPHILPLYDSGAAGDLLYYVMPYVAGESLRDRLDRDKQLPVTEAVRLARETADALGYAHRHGVVHRDIKPENILLQEDHAVVADFGIARAIRAAGGERLTQSGVLLGTPAYMSPEQMLGNSELDGRSDLYSLGCVLYEMLAGQPPFTGPTAETLVHQHLSVEPRPVMELRRAVRPEIAAALSRTLAKSPADRYSNALQLTQALEMEPPSPSGEASGVESSTRAEPSRKWRRARLRLVRVGIGIAALVLIGVGWALWRARSGAAPTATPGAVAVLPFTVRGDASLDYLGEGVVDLLSTSLDGAASLRSVDPHALLSHLRRSGGSDLGPERGRAVAEHFGAGFFVLGDVLQVGPRLRLKASLYDHARAEPIAQGAVEGVETDLSSMVDQVAVRLLSDYTGQRVDLGGRFARLAAVTTHSLPALKAYLEGEQHFRRGRYRPAMQAFQSAVRIDSTFALAWYRLAAAAGWVPDLDLYREGAERAVRHSQRLTERDRGLLLARAALDRGQVEESERHARAVVQSHPEDAEGWLALGEALYHGNPVRGRSIFESKEPLQRALALDPNHPEPLAHLIELQVMQGRGPELDSLIARARAVAGDVAEGLELMALQARMRGDRQAWASVLERAPREPRTTRFLTIRSLAVLLEDLPAAESLAARAVPGAEGPQVMANAHNVHAAIALGRGRWRAAQEALQASEALDPGTAVPQRAFLATMSFLPLSKDRVEEIRAEVERWRFPADADTVTLTAFYRRHRGLEGIIRTYLLGLLAARLGDTRAVLARAKELDRLGGDVPARVLAGDLSAGLEARVAWMRGNPQEALARIEAATMPLVFGPPSGFVGQVHERYLRAELLHAVGRDREALGWYDNFFQYMGPFAIPYLVPSHLRRAEIYEKLGQPEQAIRHYRRVLDLWDECDPELGPAVERARQRLSLLTARGA